MLKPFETEVLQINGMAVDVKYFYADDEDPPWKACDGHGPVRSGGVRDKRPGERYMGAGYLYDWQAACAMARKDKWGQDKGIEAAVQDDYDFLRAWVKNDWQYVGVVCTCEGTKDSCWGFETYKDYHKQAAKEMATELVTRVLREDEERAYWEIRGVTTSTSEAPYERY